MPKIVPIVEGDGEAEDQAPMTQWLDTTLARQRSRSFRRLCHAIEQILDAMDAAGIVVTP